MQSLESVVQEVAKGELAILDYKLAPVLSMQQKSPASMICDGRAM